MQDTYPFTISARFNLSRKAYQRLLMSCASFAALTAQAAIPEQSMVMNSATPRYISSNPHDFLSNISAISRSIQSYKPVITLTIGPDFIKTGYTQTLTLLPPFQNQYNAANSWQTAADVGGFLGVEHSIKSWLFTQLGVSGYTDETFTAQGTISQFAIPAYTNLGYQYRIHHSRVVFTNKLLTTMPKYNTLHPYFSWEVGTAFNRAQNYGEYPLIPLATPTAPFANHSQSVFTWGLGVGVDYVFTAHIRTGMGYQFADLGSASLGTTTAETTTQTLNIPHLYTNQLRFQFTFLA